MCAETFSFRAVKSVLVMAGGLKRSNPDTEEELVLIRALRDSNVRLFFYCVIEINLILNTLCFSGSQISC